MTTNPETTEPEWVQIEYTVRVYVMHTWATGAPRHTGMVTERVVEDATIMGGIRAINVAVDRHPNAMVDVHAPEIDPNPAALGWPVGG